MLKSICNIRKVNESGILGLRYLVRYHKDFFFKLGRSTVGSSEKSRSIEGTIYRDRRKESSKTE